MRIVGLLLVLVACSKDGTSCPTVDELVRDGSVRRELDIVVARCRADRWPATVVSCLRAAKTDAAMEPCFKSLSAEQVERLEAAFAPLSAELDELRATETREADQYFGHELDELHLERLAARAQECAGYRDAIDAARRAMHGCSPEEDQLELFGLRQYVLKQAGALLTIADDAQLAAACARDATELRESAKRTCKHDR